MCDFQRTSQVIGDHGPAWAASIFLDSLDDLKRARCF